jgi:hypothetical protein
MATIREEGAGTLGTRPVFPIGESRTSTYANALDPLLGSVVEGPKGRKFRLVRLNVSGGLTAANIEGRLFRPTTNGPTAAEQFDVIQAVAAGTAIQGRPIGAALEDQDAVEDNGYFWLQFDGDHMAFWLGDDGTDVAAGEFLALDDDADLGAVKTTDSTFAAETTLAVALSTNTGTDAIIYGRPIKPLNG